MKRAHLEQSGVKAQLITDVIAEEFVRGNEHRLSQFGQFMICMQVFEAFQMCNFEFIA